MVIVQSNIACVTCCAYYLNDTDVTLGQATKDITMARWSVSKRRALGPREEVSELMIVTTRMMMRGKAPLISSPTTTELTYVTYTTYYYLLLDEQPYNNRAAVS